MVDQLIDILGKEASLFESFLRLQEQQREALVANDIEQLRSVTSRLREKVSESRLLAKRREQTVQAIKEANAIEGDLNVTRLLELVSEQQAGQLRHLRDLILGLNDQIAHTRNQNAMLLNRSRDYILRMMTMLSSIRGPMPTYGSAGVMDEQTKHVAVDRRA